MSTSVRQFALLVGRFFESSVIRFGENQADPIASIHADGFAKLFEIFQHTNTLGPLLGRTPEDPRMMFPRGTLVMAPQCPRRYLSPPAAKVKMAFTKGETDSYGSWRNPHP